jgi:hypothetical protein
MTDIHLGDHVSWPGGLDFGSRTATWTGVVLSLNCGIPSAYDEMGREIMPRHPAAMMIADLPQHGLAEHHPASELPIVRLDALTLIAHDPEREVVLADLYTMHERRAAVCGCALCQRMVRRPA